MRKDRKYRRCKVVFEEIKEVFDIKTIELVVNNKGQMYDRAKVKELERKIAEREGER